MLLPRRRYVFMAVFFMVGLMRWQVGRHCENRESYGHSLIIDPWGTVLADLGDTREGIATADIDLGFLERVRREVPLVRRT